MGKRLCIDKGHGETQFNFEFSFTIDGDTWLTVLFEDLEDAREYASEVREQNQENNRLLYYARRIVQVYTSDFITDSLSAVDLRVVDRHSKYGRR